MHEKPRPAVLVLEDGTSFEGILLSGSESSMGELVFHTSMTGYQEIFSDPSYAGQLVTLCFPQVGNYGVCPADEQSRRPALRGVVIRELSPAESGHRCRGGLLDWLERHDVCVLSEVDTRAVTRHIRSRGAMRAGIFPGKYCSEFLDRVRAQPSLVGRDLTAEVTCSRPYVFPAQSERRFPVALLDFGVKAGILRELAARGLEINVFPASTPAERILQTEPRGLVLSNGPGDPQAVGGAVATVRNLLGRLPILGICLGHQLLALALGASTYKLPFGHHGGNHPVRERRGGGVFITAQNHGFAVDEKTLPESCTASQISLYDGTLEGFRAPDLKLLAVQYHPEASPGPRDTLGVFDEFLEMMQVD
jgi:carbamoyl-phosphate synthase small subunit